MKFVTGYRIEFEVEILSFHGTVKRKWLLQNSNKHHFLLSSMCGNP